LAPGECRIKNKKKKNGDESTAERGWRGARDKARQGEEPAEV